MVGSVRIYGDAMQGFLLPPIMDLAPRIARPAVIYVVRFYELLGDLCVFSASRTLAPTFMNRVTCVSFIWLPAANLLRITRSCCRTVTVQITTVFLLHYSGLVTNSL